MAKTSEEIEEQAQEVVVEVLEIVEDLEKVNNSLFRRVPKPAVNYLIYTIHELCRTVLSLAGTAAVQERALSLRHEKIAELYRDNLKLKFKIEQLTDKNNEKDTND